MFVFRSKTPQGDPVSSSTIRSNCATLQPAKSRGELGAAIAKIVLLFSPRDLQQMRWNFSESLKDVSPEYRKNLEEKITTHLHGTYQSLRLMNQQGAFTHLSDPLAENAKEYWTMVAGQCPAEGDEGSRLRFLKFLLAGFCMFVLNEPGHPVGMPFPGGDKVEVIDGVYYCPVRTRANDVDQALCPFCPALQTPGVGYLNPPVNASKHRKQEYIEHIHQGHHFNG
jgi:uncharacterized protein (UPF0305 family)